MATGRHADDFQMDQIGRGRATLPRSAGVSRD
jgi:hypothetical protein